MELVGSKDPLEPREGLVLLGMWGKLERWDSLVIMGGEESLGKQGPMDHLAHLVIWELLDFQEPMGTK